MSSTDIFSSCASSDTYFSESIRQFFFHIFQLFRGLFDEPDIFGKNSFIDDSGTSIYFARFL